jgi:hypothetical protein
VGGADPQGAAHQSFVSEVRAGLATSLGISESRITNITVTAGSIKVSFVILPPLSHSEPPVTSVVGDLESQVLNASSPLRTGGSRLTSVDVSSGVSAVVAPSVGELSGSSDQFEPSVLTNSLVLRPGGLSSGGVTMRWKILRDSQGEMVWRSRLEFNHDSWVCVGVKRSIEGVGMVDVWGVLVLPGSSTAPVREVNLFNTSLSGVVIQDSQDLRVGRMRREGGRRELRALQSSGTRIVELERRLRTTDPNDVELLADQLQRVVFAFGSSSSEGVSRDAMQYHGSSRGSVMVNFGTGDVAAAPVDVVVVLHGVLMVLAWGVCLPLGAIVARFAKRVPPLTGPDACWFRTHWILQTTGTVCSLGGFVSAIVLVVRSGGSHFSSPHKVLGLIVVGVGACVALAGRLRPAKDARIRPAWKVGHAGCGMLAVLCGFVTIFLGLGTAGAQMELYYAAGVLVGCLVLCYGSLQLCGCGPASGGGSTHKSGAATRGSITTLSPASVLRKT